MLLMKLHYRLKKRKTRNEAVEEVKKQKEHKKEGNEE